MAIATFASPALNGPLTWATALMVQVRTELRARRVYARTLRELRALSARERDDLGISQNMITRLAAESAWGAQQR